MVLPSLRGAGNGAAAAVLKPNRNIGNFGQDGDLTTVACLPRARAVAGIGKVSPNPFRVGLCPQACSMRHMMLKN